METKEVIEYKNIRFELRESFEDEEVKCVIFNHNSFFVGEDRVIFNTYNIYVDDEFKAVLVNGKGLKNVFIYDEKERKIKVIFSTTEEMGSEALFEGIYRFMNDWKERKIEVFGETRREEENKRIDSSKRTVWYLLIDKNERNLIDEWVSKLLTFGVKEGKIEHFPVSTTAVYSNKDIGLNVNEGLIKGVFENNKIFKKENIKFNGDGNDIYLNYNDTLDFFEEIDEKVKTSGQENTTVADDEKTLRGSEGGLFNKYLTSMRKGFNSSARNEMITKLIGKLAKDLVKGNISRDNAWFVLEMTSQNCNPPMDSEEIETIWNNILKKEKANKGVYGKKKII